MADTNWVVERFGAEIWESTGKTYKHLTAYRYRSSRTLIDGAMSKHLIQLNNTCKCTGSVICVVQDTVRADWALYQNNHLMLVGSNSHT